MIGGGTPVRRAGTGVDWVGMLTGCARCRLAPIAAVAAEGNAAREAAGQDSLPIVLVIGVCGCSLLPGASLPSPRRAARSCAPVGQPLR